MQLLTLKITPLSPFGTLPKGDTLFGHIVAYDFLGGHDTFIHYLDEEPKLIVSDMMPLGYVYRPTLPLGCFKEYNDIEVDKKQLRKNKFITIKNLQKGHLFNSEAIEYETNSLSQHNSIDRMTFATGGETFAPYSLMEKVYFKELWMFIMVETSLKEHILALLRQIGSFGFGKDATIGKGHFALEIMDNPCIDHQSDYYMSLSPTILHNTTITQAWYEPFTRFGKFALHHAHENAFKKPTLMADSGAVIHSSTKINYFGTSINNGNFEKPSFLQGYSIALPFLIKDQKCLNCE
jgi:CRISPR-associated protein Csm4